MARATHWTLPIVMALLGASACGGGGSSPRAASIASSSPSSSSSSAPAQTSQPTTATTEAPVTTQPSPATTQAPPDTEAPVSAPQTTAPPQTTVAPPAPQQVPLTIKDFKFSPDPIQVPVGTVVVATNQERGDEHTWTSDSGAWDSGGLAPGQSFQYTFASSGVFTYHCRFHPSMTGRAIVG